MGGISKWGVPPVERDLQEYSPSLPTQSCGWPFAGKLDIVGVVGSFCLLSKNGEHLVLQSTWEPSSPSKQVAKSGTPLSKMEPSLVYRS